MHMVTCSPGWRCLGKWGCGEVRSQDAASLARWAGASAGATKGAGVPSPRRQRRRVWPEHRWPAGSGGGTGDGDEAVPSCSFQAGKWSHRMSVQPVGTPRLPKEMTVSSGEHTGRSLSQNFFLFRKLASRRQSRMLIWE